MGIAGNMPLGVAPGMGLNAYFAVRGDVASAVHFAPGQICPGRGLGARREAVGRLCAGTNDRTTYIDGHECCPLQYNVAASTAPATSPTRPHWLPFSFKVLNPDVGIQLSCHRVVGSICRAAQLNGGKAQTSWSVLGAGWIFILLAITSARGKLIQLVPRCATILNTLVHMT